MTDSPFAEVVCLLPKNTPWSREHIAILSARFPTEGASQDLQKTLRRSKNAVEVRAQKLRIRQVGKTKRKWSSVDLAVLEARYPVEGASRALQIALDRTKNSIAAQARFSGLTITKTVLSSIHRKVVQRGKDNPLFRGCGDMRAHFVSLIRKDAVKRDIPHPLLDGSPTSNGYLWDLYVTQGRRCVLSDQLIGFTQNTAQGNERGCASLDRIDSSKGYVKGNVQWVHKHVNVMKRALSQEEFILLAHQIAKKHPRP